METKFTPGPWFALEKSTSLLGGDGYRSNVRMNIGDFVHADIWCHNEPIEVEEANAKLIAASPELYEALKGLMNRYKELVDSGDCGFWKAEDESEYQTAQAALNKAT